jgi:hypothetical protein|tara:strand:+ start:1313 stop:1633 length:321 start_codon:yes stop_codon:yes gene_type:complete
MKIKRVDEQGFALSEEDVTSLAGTELWFKLMQNRVIVQSEGFDQQIMNEINISNYYYIEEVHAKEGYEHPTEPNVQEYIHRIWFASPQDKDQFMQILAMKKLSQDV